MHFFRFTLFTTLGLFLTACGGTKDSTKSDVQSATNTLTIAVSIGDDKRIKVNETLVIEVQKVEKTEEVSSYLWQYQGNTLATTRSFTYTPTELGVNVLDFSVLYNDGTKVSDKVIRSTFFTQKKLQKTCFLLLDEKNAKKGRKKQGGNSVLFLFSVSSL